MTEEIRRQISEMTAVHQSLARVAELPVATVISGTLPFEAASEGLPTIADSFDIELAVPPTYPNLLPVVREVGGRINPKYEHLNADGSFCLDVPVEVRRVFLEQPSLLGFVNRLVVPFLYSYCYWTQHGSYPFGDRPHGAAGISRYYFELLGAEDEAIVLAVVCYLLEHGYRGHHPCPCGSGATVRKCHRDVLMNLSRWHTKTTLATDLLMLLRSLLEENSRERQRLPLPLLRRVERLRKAVLRHAHAQQLR